jgi:NAD-dependent SIR2 family protein deacetylase
MMNVKKAFNRFKAFIFHKYQIVGNIFHFRCTKCGHYTKSHVEEDYARWKCIDCDENEIFVLFLMNQIKKNKVVNETKFKLLITYE